MPNKPKTQHRSIRIPDDTWYDAMQRADSAGTKLPVLIRQWLETYAETGSPIRTR